MRHRAPRIISSTKWQLLVYSRIRYHTLAAPDMKIVVAAAAADAASDVLGAGGIPRTNNSAAAFGGADFSA